MDIGNTVKIHEHLFEQYPNIPKFANDPEESPIIRTYDLILKRFEGIYGRQPKYFVKSPASIIIAGSLNESVGLDYGVISSVQNVIVAINTDEHPKLRFNHYQNAVYGEKKFQNQSLKWKYQEQSDDYTNLIVVCLKVFASVNDMHELPGLDVLIYDDFIQDAFMHWKEAVCLGIYAALHTILKATPLTKNMTDTFLQKAKNFMAELCPITLSIGPKFNQIHLSTHKDIAFPSDIEIVMAHSMTPLPKKMTKGKRENLRICEIQIGIEIIKNQLGATNNIKSIRELQKYLDCSINELIDTVEEYIPKGEMTGEQIEQMTEKTLIQILKEIPFANQVIDENHSFKPYDSRIQYFLQEQVLLEKLTSENFIETQIQSFAAAEKMLEIGSQQISEMIKIIEGLVLGYKIVGSGWGGNLMIFCHKKNSRHVVDLLVQEFYLDEKNKILLSDDIEQYVQIIGLPANGLSVLNPESQIWY